MFLVPIWSRKSCPQVDQGQKLLSPIILFSAHRKIKESFSTFSEFNKTCKSEVIAKKKYSYRRIMPSEVLTVRFSELHGVNYIQQPCYKRFLRGGISDFRQTLTTQIQISRRKSVLRFILISLLGEITQTQQEYTLTMFSLMEHFRCMSITTFLN